MDEDAHMRFIKNIKSSLNKNIPVRNKNGSCLTGGNHRDLQFGDC
jgi:small nuclear ribonucleoprotein (snRNP)-like protein